MGPFHLSSSARLGGAGPDGLLGLSAASRPLSLLESDSLRSLGDLSLRSFLLGETLVPPRGLNSSGLLRLSFWGFWIV